MDVFSDDRMTLITQQLEQETDAHGFSTASAVCLAELSDYLAQTMKETSTIHNLLELPSSPPGQTRGPSLRRAPPLLHLEPASSSTSAVASLNT